MNRPVVLYPYPGVRLSGGEEQLLTGAATRMRRETSREWKTPDTEVSMLPSSIYMKFLGKAKLWRQEVDQRLPGAEGKSLDWLQTGRKELWGVIEVLKDWIVAVLASLNKFTKNLRTVQFHGMSRPVCKLHLHKAVFENWTYSSTPEFVDANLFLFHQLSFSPNRNHAFYLRICLDKVWLPAFIAL